MYEDRLFRIDKVLFALQCVAERTGTRDQKLRARALCRGFRAGVQAMAFSPQLTPDQIAEMLQAELKDTQPVL
ncbi:hypothetical protein V7V80_04505 [Pseudomonas kermanshahensis]|uniref:Uncharacterized protein n=1 Tax=Pseudomonas kermanshahensis TaxID=2745482 RepID=A0ABU8R256_9PSED